MSSQTVPLWLRQQWRRQSKRPMRQERPPKSPPPPYSHLAPASLLPAITPSRATQRRNASLIVETSTSTDRFQTGPRPQQDTHYTNLITSKVPGLDLMTEATRHCGKVVPVIVDPARIGHKGTITSDVSRLETAIIQDPLVETRTIAGSLRTAREATVEIAIWHIATTTMVWIGDSVMTASHRVWIGSLIGLLEITRCFLDLRMGRLNAQGTLARVLTLTLT